MSKVAGKNSFNNKEATSDNQSKQIYLRNVTAQFTVPRWGRGGGVECTNRFTTYIQYWWVTGDKVEKDFKKKENNTGE